ncbi:tetratricopeptide repeat protein [Aeromonas schubertii]|uniref:Tetratricopeptide repeat protein n=1 Tax=Aeromonas schubertii TaxID=652 RepID=A0ABS7V8C4_9GAMM|nr:tetratricopeptide repeat-containing response regulator [Aeromonas schubertii]MBZ6065211.1 tetratricopeptide repeat protein [Aeromonas schubertii]QCG48740.1 tetratricopeptide repeat protein [Aeromonas schubertii]
MSTQPRPDHDLHLLLVDEQRSFHIMMKAMLLNAGISRISYAYSAEEARRLSSKQPFDVYLIDYDLGAGENGRQLLESLREKRLVPPRSVVIMVSSDASRAMVLSAIESEPDEYLMKPFSQEQFRMRLKRALARRRALAPLYEALARQDDPALIAACEQGAKDHPRYSNFCCCLQADAMMRQGRHQEARSLLRQQLAEQDNSWLRLGLGKACHQLGLNDEASSHLQAGLKITPLMVEAYHALAESYLAQGRGAEALLQLKQAVNLSPQSVHLSRRLAEMSLQQGDYATAKDVLFNLIELTRNSIHRTPHYLGAYIQTLTLYALNSNDSFHIANLQKQVNSALSRLRDVLSDGEFNYPVFEQLCQARVQIARGELLKGKKMLYRANQNWLDKPESMPPALLGETLLGLYQLGEFEYAETLQGLLSEDEDQLLTTCIKATRDDKTVQERRLRYQQLNELGIKAYQAGELEQALGHFREALRRTPANTGAALNKIQVLLQLIAKDRKNSEYGDECRSTMSMLEGIPLNPAQQERFRKLRQEFGHGG